MFFSGERGVNIYFSPTYSAPGRYLVVFDCLAIPVPSKDTLKNTVSGILRIVYPRVLKIPQKCLGEVRRLLHNMEKNRTSITWTHREMLHIVRE